MMEESCWESEWSIVEDCCLCKTVMNEVESEHFQPTLRLIQDLFNPLPIELKRRTHLDLLRKVLNLKQPLHLKHRETASINSDEELSRWPCVSMQEYYEPVSSTFSFEEDLSLCRDVVNAWQENGGQCIPNTSWFERNVAGTNPIFESRSGHSLHQHYCSNLSHNMANAVVIHNESWSYIQIDFSWLKAKHGLTSQSLFGVLPGPTCDFAASSEKCFGSGRPSGHVTDVSCSIAPRVDLDQEDSSTEPALKRRRYETV